jgi:hypothetical protein
MEAVGEPADSPVSPETAAAVDASASADATSYDPVPVLLGGYFAVSGALLLQLAVGHVALWRLRRDAVPASALVRRVADEFGGAAVLVSDRVETPLCFGVLRPTVVLPRSLAMTGSADELRWALAHEFEHLTRGDPRTAVWVGVGRAVLFFVPWFWAVRRELGLAQEYLADAAAAAAGGEPVDYAAFLVNLSGRPSGPPESRRTRVALSAAHAARAGKTDLFRRVNMVLNTGGELSRRCPRWLAGVAGGGLMSAAVVLSGLGWAAADDDKPKPEGDRPKAERREAPPPPPRGQREADDDEKPIPPARGRDGDRPRPPQPPQPPAPPPEVGELNRKIDKAVKAGDAAEVRELVAELERVLSPRPPMPPREPNRPDGPPGFPAQPPGQPLVFRFPGNPQDGAGPEDLRRALEAQMRGLEQALAQLKDNPEAQQGVRRAMEAARRDMEKQADRLIVRGPQFGGGLVPGVRFGVAVARMPEALAEQLDLPKETGLLVADVAKGSPAEKAGLKRNDVIVKFAGQDVAADERRFIATVTAAKPGEKHELVVLRKGKKETVSVELPEPPAPPRRDGDRPRDGGDRPRDGDRRGPVELDIRLGGPNVSFESMTATVTDGKFSIKASKGETKYVVSGEVRDGRPAPDKISVNGKDYDSPKDVPEEHRPALRQLLGSVGGR